jgi:hypothetical protein
MAIKKKVEIHVSRPEHIINGKVYGVSYGLDVYKIEYTCIVDNPPYNRKYPFISINGQVKCIKMVIKMKQKGEL